MKVSSNIGICPPENGKSEKIIQQIFDEVLQTLLHHVDLKAIYCFGFSSELHNTENLLIKENYQTRQQWQLNLLLIGDNLPENATANLADTVYQKYNNEINLCLMCYSPKQIAHSKNAHKNLFAKIIGESNRIYGQDYELGQLNLDSLPQLDYNKIWDYAHNRLLISVGLMEKVKNFLEEPLTAAFMLRNIVEQLLLALLYSCIHYHPKQFHIPYLLQLCKNCCGIPTRFFPDALFQQERYKSFFKTNLMDLRLRHIDSISDDEVLMFYYNVLDFKNLIVPVIQEKYSRLLDLAK